MGGAYLYGIDLRDATLTDSKLNKDNKLISATLRGAHLQHANLQNTDLRFADLTDADPTGAYVDGARFNEAQLVGAVTNGEIGASVDNGNLPKGKPKRDEFNV